MVSVLPFYIPFFLQYALKLYCMYIVPILYIYCPKCLATILTASLVIDCIVFRQPL